MSEVTVQNETKGQTTENQKGSNKVEQNNNIEGAFPPTPLYTPVSTQSYTPSYIAKHTPKYTSELTTISTPTPNNVMELPSDNPEKENGVEQNENKIDNKENIIKNIIDETIIIERNDKKLGAEIKKIIKVGKIVKKVDPKYGFDVTIVLGTDYIP